MIKDTLRDLLSPYGATGREDIVREAIEKMVTPYVDSVQTDALGNLICIRKGEGPRIMFSAHMDHIGFIVTDIDEKGFLRVHNVGGISPKTNVGSHFVFENGTHAVLYYETKEKLDTLIYPQIYLDIGASSYAEACEKVKIGDVAVYAPDFIDMGKRAASPAMDNRAGCALLVELLARLENHSNEIVAVFSSQEEVGLRGARVAAYSVQPDYAIALDVTATGDTPNAALMSVQLGAGPAVKIMDASVICSPQIVQAMENAAEAASIPYQREVLRYGGTDAGAIQLSRGGVPSGVLSIPSRYIHSACEMVDMDDMENGVKLLLALLEKGL